MIFQFQSTHNSLIQCEACLVEHEADGLTGIEERDKTRTSSTAQRLVYTVVFCFDYTHFTSLL